MKNTIPNNLFVVIFLIVGCSTLKKIITKRAPEKNYEKALSNLKKGKSLEKNKELLITSLTEILKSKTLEKDSLINSTLITDKEKGFKVNESLYTKLEKSEKYLDGQFKAEMIQLNNERKLLKENLKKSFYTLGKMNFEEAKKNQDKYLSRNATKSLKKSKKYGNKEINNLIKESSKYSVFRYYLNMKATENKKYKTIIDNHFKKIENLKLPFVEIYYNSKDEIKYDCKIDILFDKIDIINEKSIKNKHFTKEIFGRENDSTITYSKTVRGYVYQRKKLRKLKWKIKVNSNSSKCTFTNNSFTEKILSRSFSYTISGDERAISKKYRETIGKPLLSDQKMTEKAISNVYKKIENHLKSKH